MVCSNAQNHREEGAGVSTSPQHDDGANVIRGRSVIVQPGEGPSFWQPTPANGHADPVLTPANTGFEGMSLGYQTIAPGGHVREHSHTTQVEMLICFRGRGHLVVDGVRHQLVPGTAGFFGYDVKQEIWNDGAEDLVMVWIIAPPGLENFFATIGRWRRPGEPAPAPFERRHDVVDIERAMGMNDTRA